MTSAYEGYLMHPFDYTMPSPNNNINNQIFSTEDPMMPIYRALNLVSSSTPSEVTRTNSLESQRCLGQIKPTTMPDTTSLSFPNLGFSFPINELSLLCNPNDFRPLMTLIITRPSQKRVFSFVEMSQPKSKKRARRRFDEIERVFHCIHRGCNKSYGTLNNLNAHILMQRHGSKRTTAEFKSNTTKRR